MNFRLYEACAKVGYDGAVVAGLGVENSCDDRQGQGFVAGWS